MKTVVWFGFVLGALSAAGRVIVTKTGETATLDCDYRRNLVWHRGNDMIITRGKFPMQDKGDIGKRSTERGGDLVISGVKPTDAGSFTCTADTKVYQHTLGVVSVSANPSGDLQPGSKVELQCDVDGLNPVPTIQWKRPGRSLPAGSPQTVGSVAVSDAGTWECTFSHGGETHSVSLNIKVKELATTTPPPVSSKTSKNSNRPSCTDCGTISSSGLLLGLSWWMWVVIGVGCLVVILLMVLVIVLCKRIKRKKRKLHKMKNGRQLLTPRQYCQCNRPTAAAKPQQGRRREKPSVPPLQPLLME
ncbi:T-cell surface glycoprotein CD4-like [Pagrus major]|uniref:T-cell surface glycoprotein CD4-like n=1 Tax=Pagrus major TaxID=143350 RepID=UPI003CC89E0B